MKKLISIALMIISGNILCNNSDQSIAITKSSSNTATHRIINNNSCSEKSLFLAKNDPFGPQNDDAQRKIIEYRLALLKRVIGHVHNCCDAFVNRIAQLCGFMK